MTEETRTGLNRRQLLGSTMALAAGAGTVAPRALLGAGAGLAMGGVARGPLLL